MWYAKIDIRDASTDKRLGYVIAHTGSHADVLEYVNDGCAVPKALAIKALMSPREVSLSVTMHNDAD
jgi:hypothetical protein